jgi:hypothetical protein
MLTLCPFVKAIGVPLINNLKYKALFLMSKRLPELPVPITAKK